MGDSGDLLDYADIKHKYNLTCTNGDYHAVI